MPIQKDNTNDIIMDLEIPLDVYLILFLIIIFIIIFKYFFSKEEIFEFISNEEDRLNLLTKLNTKINRDYLDNSNYYNETGYFKIYGNKKEKTSFHSIERYQKDKSHNNNIFIKKNKKVCFSENIIYENEKQ